MNCDNCNEEITIKEARHISSSRELHLLRDNGGNISDLRNNKICCDCESLAIRLIIKENKGLNKNENN